MAAYNVVSADSHVSEPRNLWTERMPAKFKDRSPKIVQKQDGDWFECDSLRPFPVALGINAGQQFADYKPTGMTYEDGRAGGWDPHARIKDQDIDGVEAEVLYPTLGMGMFALQDAEFQKVCFMVMYFGQMATARRAHGAEDLITALVEAEVEGEALEEWEIMGFCILLLIAGNETTTWSDCSHGRGLTHAAGSAARREWSGKVQSSSFTSVPVLAAACRRKTRSVEGAANWR